MCDLCLLVERFLTNGDSAPGDTYLAVSSVVPLGVTITKRHRLSDL